MGHPISYNWYEFAPHMGTTPATPQSPSRIIDELERIPELDPYAVIFPYIRMGRSITGFVLNETKGKFGPFENQIFLGDYTQSIIMRATTEQINGVWQGACYPFREGLSTGILNIHFTPEGKLLTGGTNRGWPVRGLKPYALERIEWTGLMPFEIERVSITPDGFRMDFTKAVGQETGAQADSYVVTTFTHHYQGGYGGPEIEALFCGQLDAERHPSFADLKGLKVSSHFLIRRDGGLVQFVATTDRAWHAGQSEFQSRTSCNDFSIGIELEGSDDEAFTPVQMTQLLGLSALLVTAHSSLRYVVGHSDIAPGRKTDPGPFFDWQTFLSGCQETGLGLTNPFLKII
jgi:hypothetical protein